MDYQIILNTTIGCWNCSKEAVAEKLSHYKDKPVNVLISSPGGLLDDGLDIMRQFRDHGDVTVYISGFTASAATVAAMGARKILMGKYSFLLVHKCSNFIDAWGNYNADQIQALIDELTANKKENDKIDVVLAQLYADRCGKPISDILNILREGKWLNATEALELGLIDEISPYDKKQNLSLADKDRFLCMDLPIDNIKFEEDAPSWFARFFNSIKKSVNTPDDGSCYPEQKDNGEKLNISTKMAKFNSLGKILNKEDFATAENGTVTLTCDELQAVEMHIATLEGDISNRDATVSERDTTISEMQKQIDNLQKQPGDISNDVQPVNSLEVAAESKKLYENIKDI